ncbi:hypothetical protein [Sinobaca sp. H24]|uniref:hypothetical protein n=1 Tax=Sinobaca sp. H24 TaxID=2923376 RepID=UPI00207A039F|nr:hypothetical protein [Sinobaca sp. H24]
MTVDSKYAFEKSNLDIIYLYSSLIRAIIIEQQYAMAERASQESLSVDGSSDINGRDGGSSE